MLGGQSPDNVLKFVNAVYRNFANNRLDYRRDGGGTDVLRPYLP